MTWLGRARLGSAGQDLAGRSQARQDKELSHTGDTMATSGTIGARRYETEQLTARIMAMEIGDVLTYAEMRSLTGLDHQNGARGLLYTAMKAAWREGVLCGTSRGVGIVRLTSEEAATQEIGTVPARLHRIATRAVNRSANIEYESLSEQGRQQLDGCRTVLLFAQGATSKKARKKIADSVNGGGTMPFAKTLELFT